MYAAVRGPAPARRGVLVAREDRSSPHPCPACIRARRRYTRSRRRRREDEATVARLYKAYREARRPLQRAINEAKRRAWGEFLASLDADPWGRPYKMVLNKLRPWAPPTTESMDPRFLEEVAGTLFPGATDEENNKFTNEEEQEPQHSKAESRDPAGSWSPESRVTEEELANAVGRIGARKAPGPDGVRTCLWKDVAGVLAPRLMRLYDRCLSRGEFPVLWKEARMILLTKQGRSPDSPSAYWPVCLLDGAGKLLERVVAARLESHLSRSVPGLHDSQFGFRRGRYTADAVACVRFLVEGAGDTVNAFNSIPWDRICRALEFHRVPVYLRGVVRAFLWDRSIAYTVRGGGMIERAVIMVVRGFRTISAAAAAGLAGFSPLELQALRCLHLHTRGLSDWVEPVGDDVEGRARRALLDRWRVSLDMRAGAPGLRVLEAVLPNWDVWLDGAGPLLTYRVT